VQFPTFGKLQLIKTGSERSHDDVPCVHGLDAHGRALKIEGRICTALNVCCSKYALLNPNRPDRPRSLGRV
jgi:hypothetical protein